MYVYIRLILAPIIDPFINGDVWPLVLRFMPYVIFLELPYTILVILGVVKYAINRAAEGERRPFYPPVSCIITCYSEGFGVQETIRSIAEQIYPGRIQMLAMVDGATRNALTLSAATQMVETVNRMHGRELMIVPKWKRGGRVSNLNTGLNYATGDIIFALDGDTSFDNNMIERATRHFEDPTVSAVSGCLRVKNAEESVVTSLQAIEYFISIQASKTGLSSFNMVNNVSGAFGIFRRSILELVGGWDAGTAEDLDLTIRIKNYFGRYGDKFKIIFDPEAIGHTDVPETLGGFLRQRIRWDGDLSYIYIRKHWHSFSPKILGWPNFIMVIVTGLFAQLVLPVIIFIYTLWLFFAYPLHYTLGLMLLVYLFYLVLTAAEYCIFAACLSERPEEDLSRICYLPLFPIFNFIARLNGLVATIWELVHEGHKDSSMAPWWVMKKNKF